MKECRTFSGCLQLELEFWTLWYVYIVLDWTRLVNKRSVSPEQEEKQRKGQSITSWHDSQRRLWKQLRRPVWHKGQLFGCDVILFCPVILFWGIWTGFQQQRPHWNPTEKWALSSSFSQLSLHQRANILSELVLLPPGLRWKTAGHRPKRLSKRTRQLPVT